MATTIYDKIIRAVIHGEIDVVREQVQLAINSGCTVTEILDNALLRAMHIIGERFEKNEIYVTELLISARGVHEGINTIRPKLMEEGASLPNKGRVLLGTVAGDLHDIGKNLLGLILEARGFEVIDLGVDVSSSSFVEAVGKYEPDAVCLSVLLTTTVKAAEDTVKSLSAVKQSRHRFQIFVGGAAMREDIASAMGADGYAPDAISGAKLIENVIARATENEEGHFFSGAYELDEINTMQNSFRELTGVDLVFLDAHGIPFVGGELFASCSKKCHEWNDFLAHSHIASSLYDDMTEHNHYSAVAYRCRCGLMEVSCPIMSDMGNIGTALCGHFLMEGDIAKEDNINHIPVLTNEQLHSLCSFVGLTSKKMAMLVENVAARRELEGQQKSFVDFIKKQQKLEADLKEAELSALQYQVNPHFLFNSLNTIARVALIEGDKHTEKLVSALARLMRYSLYQVKATVTLEEEVKTVTDYLMIQETRFQGRISHRIDVENSILMTKMPCMILQPLVENACQHGLEPTKRGGIISIQGWQENGNVFLEVSDNGVGMSAEQVNSIFKLEDIHSSKGGQVSGLGMNNVLSRLQFFFGSDCAWDVHSELNKGTTLQLSFPLK